MWDFSEILDSLAEYTFGFGYLVERWSSAEREYILGMGTFKLTISYTDQSWALFPLNISIRKQQP